MECAGRALSGDGALASGVANSVLIEAITCAGRSANGFTASSPEHTQDLRTFIMLFGSICSVFALYHPDPTPGFNNTHLRALGKTFSRGYSSKSHRTCTAWLTSLMATRTISCCG